jgi:hypothetical protein
MLVAALVPFAFSAAAPWALAQETVGESALTQIHALERQKLDRTPAQRKMDSQLLYGLHASALERVAPELRPDLQIAGDGRVLVDITAVLSKETPGGPPSTAARPRGPLPRQRVGVLGRIEDLGGTVVSSFPEYRAVRALLPLSSLETLAEDPDVLFIERAAEATTNTGSVTGEGDATHRSAATRTVFGVTGTGVNVGVLSDSVDFLAASQGLGDIGAVTVLPGQSGVGTCGGPCTGEGTAMLEIVADIAPAATLFFATGFGSQASMAANIVALQAAGCNVIVDDVTYFAESPFQDGTISQAVNTVSAAGALYFSSARNSGNQNDGTSGTWEGDFADGGAVAPPVPGSGRLHSFGGATFDTVAAGGSNRRVDLFWADPLGGSSNDYDLFVLNSAGTAVLRSSTNSQTGSQNPYESVGTLNVGERIVIVRAAAAANRFLHLDTGRARLTTSTSGNVRGHNASGAANAFSVAATDVANSAPAAFVGGATNPVETFSSDGPRRMFFTPGGTPITPGNFSSTGGTVLQKPDVTAADGVTSSAAIPGFNPFFGTSAAAPHAAAIAALLLSFSPTPTPAQIRAALNASALDIEAAGFDRDSGAGIVMAFGGMKAINPCTITCSANLTRSNDANVCGAVASYPAPNLVGGCFTTTCGPASGSFFPVGTTPVACQTASEDSCAFTVTVNDTQAPSITCPANVSRSTDPGVCSAVVSYAAPAVSDNCPGLGAPACAPPSGSVFPQGATPVGCAVDDAAGNTSGCGFSVAVIDTEPPRVFCSVATPRLWPPNHDLVDVGLTATATDNCAGPLPIAVHVFGNEDDLMPTGDGNFSPDAKDIAPGTLRLRRERGGDGDGRVYLEVGSTADTSGNAAFACCTVVVPHSQSRAGILSVTARAAEAQAFCSAGGTAPPDYFVVGDGPVIGPKQ